MPTPRDFHGAARAVQTAILERLGAHGTLRGLFRAGSGPAPQRPSLSFDEMRSEGRPDESGLAEHALRFSVWTEPHDADQAAALSAQLEQAFAEPLRLADHAVIQLIFAPLRSAMDWSARSWRVQLEMRVLTQSGPSLAGAAQPAHLAKGVPQ